jgi:hypothetical protein
MIKCQMCGDMRANLVGPCEVCGHCMLQESVRLTDPGSGLSREFRVSTSVGRRLLEKIAGDEAIYASELQFEIVKDQRAGHWMLRHISTAVHPTYYNGHPIDGEPAILATGGVITIGPVRMKLNVVLSS